MGYSYPILRFHCDHCGRPQAVRVEDLKRDLGTAIAGDICCEVCHFVIATIHGDNCGEVSLRMADDVANEIAASAEGS